MCRSSSISFTLLLILILCFFFIILSFFSTKPPIYSTTYSALNPSLSPSTILITFLCASPRLRLSPPSLFTNHPPTILLLLLLFLLLLLLILLLFVLFPLRPPFLLRTEYLSPSFSSYPPPLSIFPPPPYSFSSSSYSFFYYFSFSSCSARDWVG